MKRLFGLQYLRAIAALIVVAYHAANELHLSFAAGAAGVDLFFVLSGFLMVAITGRDTRFTHFFASRVRRIVPVYWIVTSAFAVGVLLHLFAHAVLLPRHVLASYFFIPAFDPIYHRPWPLVVPGWTLNYEMMFYLVFACMLPLRAEKLRVLALTALFSLAVLLGLLWKPTSAIGITYTSPIMLEFVEGAWLGVWWKSNRLPVYGGVTLIVVGCALFVGFDVADLAGYRLLASGVPAALVVAGVLLLERRQPIARYAAPLLVGDASYSIYIWHTLLLAAALKLLRPLSLATPMLFCVELAIGAIGGITAYKVLEEPLIRYFKERRAVRGIPVPGGP